MSKKQEARSKKQVRQGAKADVANYLRRDSYRKRKAKPLSEVMAKQFDPAKMGPGLKRGMVLYIYRSKIAEVLPKKQLGRCLNDLKSAWMSEDPPVGGQANEQTVLFIRFKPGSIWKTEMQMYRHRIKWLINERLKSDFLREVKIR